MRHKKICRIMGNYASSFFFPGAYWFCSLPGNLRASVRCGRRSVSLSNDAGIQWLVFKRFQNRSASTTEFVIRPVVSRQPTALATGARGPRVHQSCCLEVERAVQCCTNPLELEFSPLIISFSIGQNAEMWRFDASAFADPAEGLTFP